jgi:uncharacterized protein YcbX
MQQQKGLALTTITQITIYPIKSCRGINVSNAEVTPTGLKYDRQFVLVDSDGKFLSQRQIPKMSLIKASIGEAVGNTLLATYPGSSTLVVPLHSNPERPDPSIPVDIFGKIGYGTDVGSHAAQWFSEHLGVQCRLLRYDEKRPRRRHQKGPGDEDIPLTFSDGFPILLIGEESLADLNGRMKSPIAVNRFRPNIVIAGGQAFEEDGWTLVRVGNVRFSGQKLCERCSVPLINPETGIPDHREPLATLATYRRIPSAPGKEAGPVVFGKNLSVAKPGMIFVGHSIIATSI